MPRCLSQPSYDIETVSADSSSKRKKIVLKAARFDANELFVQAATNELWIFNFISSAIPTSFRNREGWLAPERQCCSFKESRHFGLGFSIIRLLPGSAMSALSFRKPNHQISKSRGLGRRAPAYALHSVCAQLSFLLYSSLM